jgi:hypothetical protein
MSAFANDLRDLEEAENDDIRARASRARTEDEYLDVIRESGSLGAGLEIMAGVFRAPPDPTTYRGRERLLLLQEVDLTRAVIRARQDAYASAYRAALAAGQSGESAHESALAAEEVAERETRSNA